MQMAKVIWGPESCRITAPSMLWLYLCVEQPLLPPSSKLWPLAESCHSGSPSAVRLAFFTMGPQHLAWQTVSSEMLRTTTKQFS